MKQLTDEQKHFREIVRAYHTELVLHPGGWGDDLIPLWQNQVIRQRLEMIDNGGWNKATDAEVAIYLSAASGAAPFDRDWTDIFVHEVSLLMGNAVYNALGEPNNGLTDYQKTEVEHLKHQIRDKQIKVEKKGVAMLKNKILIEEREDGTLFGISRDGVDPYVKKLGLTWEQTIAQLPFLKEIKDIAEEQWKLSPKNPEVKKVEPAKKTPKKTAKPEQPALTAIEKPEAPIVSVTEPKTNSPSENVVEKEPVIPAPIASVAEAPPKQPAQPAQAPTDAQIKPKTEPGLISQTPEPVPAEQQVTTPAGFPITPAEAVSVLEHHSHRVSADAFQYRLAHPPQSAQPAFFATVQEALDALGVDKATRPTHNRYDRLSKKLQEEIVQEKKV